MTNTYTITIPKADTDDLLSIDNIIDNSITISTGVGGYNGTFSTSGNWGYTNSITNGINSSVMSIPYGEDKVVIEPQAELEVKGRVRINGEYLDERLERIETLLNIPTRDIGMENKYHKLKELWESYNRELAKYKTWDALK